MDALVLSGGNIRGAYQAGAIQAVLAARLAPQIITGTSVGALNAAYLAAYQPQPSPAAAAGLPDWTWPQAGARLADFWLREITGPAKVMRKRGFLELAYRIVRKRWKGAVDMDPMARLVHDTLDGKVYIQGATVQVASVNLATGALTYTGQADPDFLDAVVASTAEPVSMAWRHFRGVPHYDGGLMEIAPLQRAIDLGASRVVAVLCQPEGMPSREMTMDLTTLVGRVMQLVTYEILRNDLRRMASVNRQLRQAKATGLRALGLDDKQIIPLTVVRPSKGIAVNLETFTAADIQTMVELGRQDGAAAMARPPE